MSVEASGGLYLRSMTAADIDEVMTIETAAFASPWSRQFFLEELQAAHAGSILCQREGRPIGYVVYWELPGELDIHNVAVHPQCRRQGVARAMLRNLIESAAKRGLRRMTLEVRRSNDPAQTLYRSMGFEVCGLRKGYYSDNGEDAWLMERTLQPARNESSGN